MMVCSYDKILIRMSSKILFQQSKYNSYHDFEKYQSSIISRKNWFVFFLILVLLRPCVVLFLKLETFIWFLSEKILD